jgi:YD repeat-containing protein
VSVDDCSLPQSIVPLNLTSVSGVNGNFAYTYDNARNRVSMTDGNHNTTGYQYDARKRLIETDYPDETKTINAYDGPGNLVSVTDQAEKVVEYTYDAANQLQTVVQANSPNSSANITVVGYDADGNPVTLEDANTHTTSSSFDLLGEMTGKTLPGGSLTETRQYDAAGNLTSLAHFNGVTTTYTYDNLNRLLSRTTPGEAAVSFTYTATGQAPHHGRRERNHDVQLRQHGPSHVQGDAGRNAFVQLRYGG